MKIRIVFAASAAIAMAAPALAQGWVQLGEREVSDRVDRDVISVGGRARFRQIRLCVGRNPVRIYDMDVRFRNGGNQDVRLRARLAAGQCSRVINLEGRGGRDISSVAFTYEAASIGRERSHIRLFGR